MGKIPEKDECPIDIIFNRFANYISPAFKKLDFTPNGITTLSLLFGLLAAWFLYKGYVIIFAILYVISYFFDDMDGLYARRYKMTSKIGDWYDHIKDLLVGILIIIILIIRFLPNIKCGAKNNPKVWILLGIAFLFITLLMAAFVGCQAKIYKNGDSTYLYKKLCFCNPKKGIQVLKYFGPGTWTILFVILIVIIEKKLCSNK